MLKKWFQSVCVCVVPKNCMEHGAWRSLYCHVEAIKLPRLWILSAHFVGIITLLLVNGSQIERSYAGTFKGLNCTHWSFKWRHQWHLDKVKLKKTIAVLPWKCEWQKERQKPLTFAICASSGKIARNISRNVSTFFPPFHLRFPISSHACNRKLGSAAGAKARHVFPFKNIWHFQRAELTEFGVGCCWLVG